MARGLLILLVLSAAANVRGEAPTADAERLAYFEQTIRPLLVEHCYECHSAQAKVLQGGLLLDSRPGWQKGGDSGPTIVPGHPEKSLLVRAVEFREDDDIQMPPKGKLADREIAALRHWVSLGAPDPRLDAPTMKSSKRTINLAEEKKHWAYQPLATAEVPVIADDDWSLTAVDKFISAKQLANGIEPNSSADRRTFIRRATFDLTGLPPTPEEIEALLADTAPDAYERLIDRLLASPAFGERWGRYWLDLARFAESHGYEQDYDRPHAYHYRDFVIRALNDDLPFNEFVRWQIAGDELEPDNALALAATGFLAAGVHATQITANQAEKERYDELDDIVRTIGTTMLGLTIGCARCHDHKFDPIPNADYYRLVSCFTTTVRSNQYVNYDAAAYERERAKFEKRLAPLLAKRQAYENILDKRFGAWLNDEAPKIAVSPWIVVDPQGIAGADTATAKVLDDGSVRFFSSSQLKDDSRSIGTFVELDNLRSVRIEALVDPHLPQGGPGWGENGDFQLDELVLTIKEKTDTQDAEPQKVKLRRVWSSNGEQDVVTEEKKTKKTTPWTSKGQTGKPQVAVYVAEKPFGFVKGCWPDFTLNFANRDVGIGRVRLSFGTSAKAIDADAAEIPYHALVGLRRLKEDPAAKPTDLQHAALQIVHRQTDPHWKRLNERVEDAMRKQPMPQLQQALICSEGVPAVRLNTQGPDFYDKTFMLRRGDPNQKLGEAAPGYLQVLMTSPEQEKLWHEAPPEGSRTSYRRRALASWLTDSQYGAGQLLARVIVNRLWHHHLGQGIVATPSDFGTSGARPTHPELLDYLAKELIRNGWQLKPIHKLIMTSAVYRQSSQTDAARLAKDVDNLWCWHRPIVRLEAEAIRDNMLSTSGVLDRRLFGSGSSEADQPRRSIYFFIKRSRLQPMMTLFDGPDTLQDLAVRAETTIAPQSLLLMNSPAVRSYADAFARRLLADRPNDPAAAITRGYQLALGRAPSADELRRSQAFVAAQAKAYTDEKRSKADELAWSDFCQVLFCLNEFIYIR
ncbi:MAG TPA: PSD1 and planctomycete cytochrome C domain-containing protein [Pirellulales bacterium]|jgi:hypothetical protein|nr:PSD1 and planctomycete cytochrome C domain-containing protein [Pirellulales bacterium]